MNTLLIILGSVCALGIVANLALQLKKPQTPTQPADLSKDLARLERELEQEKKEKNEFSGKNKQLFAEREQLKAELTRYNVEIERQVKELGLKF